MLSTKPPLAVTTSSRPSLEVVNRAQAAAIRLGVPYVRRLPNGGLSRLLRTEAEALLLFEHGGVNLVDGQGSIPFHPGLAHLRILRLEAGERDDTFLRVAELREGEQLLDCTLGLAQDALVAARAVGPTGRVVGLEKSLTLHALMSEGLSGFDFGPKSSRVEVAQADAREHLLSAPLRSFDVVYFDPMFETPRAAQPSFELLRRHAHYGPLTEEMLHLARQVARRLVLVKGARHSQDLRKLGLQPITLSRVADVAWAKLEPL